MSFSSVLLLRVLPKARKTLAFEAIGGRFFGAIGIYRGVWGEAAFPKGVAIGTAVEKQPSLGLFEAFEMNVEPVVQEIDVFHHMREFQALRWGPSRWLPSAFGRRRGSIAGRGMARRETPD